MRETNDSGAGAPDYQGGQATMDKTQEPRTKSSAPPAERGQRGTQRPQVPRTKKRWLFLAGIIGVAVLVLLFILGWLPRIFRGNQEQQTTNAVETAATTVQVTRPRRAPSTFAFSLPGAAQALDEAVLYARTTGYIAQRFVDIGDHVEAGQLLATISAPDVDAQLLQTRANLEQSRAALEIARLNFEREKDLLRQKVVSQQDFDTAKATYNQAVATVKAGEANVQLLEVTQGFQKITAQFSGVITTRSADVGTYISATGTTPVPIFTLSESDVLRIFIFVPQSYAPSMKVGEQVDVLAPDYPNEKFKGTVTRMADALDPTARTERVEIQIGSQNGKLLPGMYLTVEFQVQQTEPILLVPASTLDIRAEGPRVAVVGADDRVHYKSVTLGRDFGVNVEIANGLQGDERLVMNPTTDLIEGEKVHVEEKKPDAQKPNGSGKM